MEATRIVDIVKMSGKDRKKVDAIVDKLGIEKFLLPPNAWAVTNEDAQVLLKELGLPIELQGETFWARHLHDAGNRRYVYAKVEGFENKHPILIPPRFHGKLKGKRFPVERIEDKNGVTWRHAWFRKLKSYGR
jgi:hypothetical protein